MDLKQPSLYRLGIVGAGQIARMTHQAALKLGITPRLLAEHKHDVAAQVAPDARFGHPDALSVFAEMCDVVTFEHERVDLGLLKLLEESGTHIRPGTKTITPAFDKLHQRMLLSKKGFVVPGFAELRGPDDLLDFSQKYSYPLVIKSIKAALPGQSGVWIVQDQNEAMRVISEHSATPLMIEEFKPLLGELVAIVARRPGGNKRLYPLAEVFNRDGRCREVHAPATVGANIAAEARELAMAIADEIEAVGVLAVELLLTSNGLVVNELAARPHNAGHLSLEGCPTSQFENHIRAILDLPLGATWLRSKAAVTVNVIGERDGVDPIDNLADALAVEGAHVHLYGKIPAPDSKLGHVTALGDNIEQAREIARRAEAVLMGHRYLKGERE